MVVTGKVRTCEFILLYKYFKSYKNFYLKLFSTDLTEESCIKIIETKKYWFPEIENFEKGSMRSAFDFENPYLSITRSNYSLGGTSPNRVDSENPPQSPLVEEREPSPEIIHEKSAEPRSMVELVVEETGRKMPYLTEQFVVVMMATGWIFHFYINFY